MLGGQLLLVTSWRGIFALLAAAGALLLVTATFRVPETLPVHRRRIGGLDETLRRSATVAARQGSSGPWLALVLRLRAGCSGYLAGSPFLLQDVHGMSAQAYSAVFAINTIGLTGLARSVAASCTAPGRGSCCSRGPSSARWAAWACWRRP